MKSEYKPWRDVMLDVMGRYRTSGLFYEFQTDAAPALFTLQPKDRIVSGVTYRSLKAIYFSYDHIPNYEYEFAMDVFGSWEHWVWLTTKSQVRKHMVEWRNEYDIMLKNLAHRTLISQAGDKEKGLNAAKMIVAEEYKGTKRGRPSKAEVERERKIEAGVRDTLDDDMARLGLKVVK